ncbi:MAG: superoxide dismutase, partial [Comamonadaceae bacterium]
WPDCAAQPSTTATTTATPRSPAMARLLTADGRVAGQARLADTPQGLQVSITVEGMTPGLHGFHVHAHGACEPGPDGASGRIVPFGAAGPHFDPGVSRNHGAPGTPPHQAHAGELPNITVGADGRGSLQYVNPHLTLAPGKTSALGRTLIVHENADDYQTDPSGNSGGRALCGLIEPAEPGAVAGRAVIDHPNAYPEGIAVDARGNAYVGSTSEGHIWRIAPGASRAELFQQGGSAGRAAAFGMKVDPQGRLWVAGGPQGTVSVLDLASGATLATVQGPQDRHMFLNDLVPAAGHVYVTDSFRPVLYRLRPTAGSAVALEPWLDLSKTPIRYKPNEINLNGIVASPDGRYLLSVQLATGQLWRIDTQSKAVMQVRIEGDLTAGDGLVLVGAHLWVMRNAHHELARVRLAVDWGGGRVEQRVTDSRLNYPTTAAMSSAGLMVANGQLDRQKNPPVLLPFDVVTVELPRSSP